MFQVRLFLRNHSPVYRWEELTAEVKQFFPSAGGPQAWAEFYIADPRQRLYYFEFVQPGQPKPRIYQADLVMLQEACELLTLVIFPRQKGHLLESIGLSTATIESAVFKAKRRKLQQ